MFVPFLCACLLRKCLSMVLFLGDYTSLLWKSTTEMVKKPNHCQRHDTLRVIFTAIFTMVRPKICKC